MTRIVTDQWSLHCFDYTFLPGMFEHAPPKCLLTYLWTICMYYWSAHVFFLPTNNTVHPTSETTAIHEKTKGTQMLLSRKDSFSSCWKKANFVPHLSAFSFVCYWEFLQIPNAAKLVTQQFLLPSFILNCFSTYQSQVCWKPSQKNLPIQKSGWGKRASRKEKLFPQHFKQLLSGTSSCSRNYFTYLHQVSFQLPAGDSGLYCWSKIANKASSIVSFNETTVPENAVLPNSSPKSKDAPRLHFLCNSAQYFTWQTGRWALNVGSADSHVLPDCSYCHRIMELFRLEDISRIIRPNH